jgi:hypothetical protein
MPGRQQALVWGGVAIVVVFAYGWWAVSLPPFSWQATAAVVGGGAVGLLVGSRRRRRSRGKGPATGVGWWLAVAGAMALWQLVAYVQAPRHEHPTVSSLANALLETQPARATAFVLWVLGGVALAQRR